jgi:hypothetical protein
VVVVVTTAGRKTPRRPQDDVMTSARSATTAPISFGPARIGLAHLGGCRQLTA